MTLPNAFVWTKMGAESGEALAAIVRRKDYERRLGSGLFAWGIGNALGNGIAALAAGVQEPLAVFSAMPSKPKKEDMAPASVLLWTAYEGADGIVRPLPGHMVVTSRGHAGDSEKVRHYVLFCQADTSLLDCKAPAEGVAPAALRNLTTGNALGASQVTAVVRHVGGAPDGVRSYPIAFTAKLAGVRYARLLAPRALTAIDLDDMAIASTDLDAWERFARWIRRPMDHIDSEVLERGRGSSSPELGAGHRCGTY